MNSYLKKPFAKDSGGFEETLRLIANLPAPEGLEERVEAGLRARPRAAANRARILRWPAALRMENAWLRAAAAAAIVFVIAGGGWGVYSHVRTAQPARVLALPPHAAAPGGFSNAGAMRTPQTLNGPAAPQPAAQQPVKPAAKPAARAKRPVHRGKPAAAKKAIAKPAAPEAR